MTQIGSNEAKAVSGGFKAAERDETPVSLGGDRGPYLNLSGFGRLPLIRQAASAECGLACLSMIASYHGYRTDLTELRQKFEISLRGADLKTIIEVAANLGLGGRAVRLEAHEMRQLRTPCILHWDFDHFVVLKKATKRKIIIHDPGGGVLTIPLAETVKRFTGVALELTPADTFKKKKQPPGLTLSKLVRFDRSFLSSFSLGLLLSLIGEAFVLAAPFYMQTVVDEVLMKGDQALLTALAIGFALLICFQVMAGTLRSLTFLFLGHVLSFDMAARVFHRMMKLPVNYFSNRTLGDVQHRIQSLQQIKRFLVSGAPMALLDGVFGVVILAILFAYNTALTGLVLGAVFVYVLWRLALYGLMRRAAGDLIVAEAETQTQLLESLRAMPTLKITGSEVSRESRWRNANARRLNAGLRVGNLDVANQTFNTFLFQGLRVAVIFLAARMALDGGMTIGMLTAFMAYYSMFTQRTIAFVDQMIVMKLLEVPLKRIGDIVLSRPEDIGSGGGRKENLKGEITVKDVHFKYGKAENAVLRGASLKVKQGEFVAITGASGAGKTTLLKILAGLEQPTRGAVLYDGRPLSNWNLQNLRKQIGVVLQEDALFKGAVAENVALFDEEIDMPLVRDCCARAGLKAEIEKMPMGYQTMVGDMGSTLSGGQKQRLLLARALYRKPKALLLDEATSHLDARNEKNVLSSIADLGITRIVIAHRKETIEAADRVVAMKNGRLSVVNKPPSRDLTPHDGAPEKPCSTDVESREISMKSDRGRGDDDTSTDWPPLIDAHYSDQSITQLIKAE